MYIVYLMVHGVYMDINWTIIMTIIETPLIAKCSDELSISIEQLHVMIVCYTHCTTTVNGHTMWIANLPWCSTLNYQT